MPRKTPVKIVRRTTSNPAASRSEVELEDSNLEPEEVDDEVETDEETEDTDVGTATGKPSGKTKGGAGAQRILDAFGGVDFLTALVSDPDVQSILTARRAGSKTKIVLDGETAEEEITEIEETDAVDEVVDELDDDTKKLLKALRTDIKTQLKPLTDKVAALEGVADNYQQQAVSAQIKTVAKKHPDFNKYRKSMGPLARQHPGLSVEELLIIAKSRAGDLNMATESTHSERPTPTPRRRAAEAKKRTGVAAGSRKEFQDILAAGLENLEFVEE